MLIKGRLWTWTRRYRLEAANAELKAVKADPKRDASAETRVLKAQKAAAQRLTIAQKKLNENRPTLTQRLGGLGRFGSVGSTSVTAAVSPPARAISQKGKSTGLSSGAPRAPAAAADVVPPSIANVATLANGPSKPKDDDVDSTA